MHSLGSLNNFKSIFSMAMHQPSFRDAPPGAVNLVYVYLFVVSYLCMCHRNKHLWEGTSAEGAAVWDISAVRCSRAVSLPRALMLISALTSSLLTPPSPDAASFWSRSPCIGPTTVFMCVPQYLSICSWLVKTSLQKHKKKKRQQILKS